VSVQQSAKDAVATTQTGVQPHRGIHAATWLAWFIWTLSVLFGVLYVFLASINPQGMGLIQGIVPPWFVPSVLMFPTVGALIASRRPHNPIGWLFLSGSLALVGASATQYGLYTLLTDPGSLPGGLEAMWIGLWLPYTGVFSVLILAVLLFPSGHLPSTRWRPVAWLAIVFMVLYSLVVAFKPGLMIKNVPASGNPYGIVQFAGPLEFINDWLAEPIYAALIIASAVSLIERFRHAHREERQQLKWIAYASAFLMVVFAIIAVLKWSLGVMVKPELSDLTNLLLVAAALAMGAFPVAVGIAILRHHLFDIDLIINRTLVYVPLTAILGGLYSSSIVLFQKLFIAATGEKSDAAIVLTTLILAASFTPIKNWLQAIADKRFKEVPDPARRLRAFGEQIQNDYSVLDPVKLTRCLLEETVQAFEATSGALYPQRNGGLELTHVYGEWKDGEAQISVPLQCNGERYGLIRLGKRKHGHEYTEKDRETLRQVADIITCSISSRQ
jgi:hypothetical protein